MLADMPGTPTWAWDSPELRTALARLDLGSALTIIRQAAGLSQLEMGGILDWDPSNVGRVERGERQSLYDLRTLLGVADRLGMPRTALAPVILGEVDVDLNRRQFVESLLGTTAALALSEAPSRRPRFQVPDRVHAAQIRFFRESIERLCSDDQQLGGGHVLETALQQLALARQMLADSLYTTEVGDQLVAICGELEVRAGWSAYDAGNYALAGRLYTDALGRADGGDLAVHARANAALLIVRQASKTGNPRRAREALRLTDRALSIARAARYGRQADLRVHALLASREAVAHALIGDGAESQHALDRAHRDLDRADRDDEDVPTWMQFMTPIELGSAAGTAEVYLGRPARAIAAYEVVLKQATSPRNRVVYGAQSASARALSGDTAGAIAEALPLLPAFATIKSPRAFQALADVRDAAGADSDFSAAYADAERLLAA